MLHIVLAVALTAQIPDPPTDEQVCAALPNAAVDVPIRKTPRMSADGTVWTCVAFYTEVVNGGRRLRVQTVFVEQGRKEVRGTGDYNTPAIPKQMPYRR
jgi:hypothetical protein